MKDFEELLNQFYNNELEDLKGKIWDTTNELNQIVILEVHEDNLVTRTLQDNGWSRINIYWKDKTREEFYQK